jgi:hypothetical protein
VLDNSDTVIYYVFVNAIVAFQGTFLVDTATHRFRPVDQEPFVGGRLDMTGDVDGDGRHDLLAAGSGWAPNHHPDGAGAALVFLGR